MSIVFNAELRGIWKDKKGVVHLHFRIDPKTEPESAFTIKQDDMLNVSELHPGKLVSIRTSGQDKQ